MTLYQTSPFRAESRSVMVTPSLKCNAPGCTFKTPARGAQTYQEIVEKLQVTAHWAWNSSHISKSQLSCTRSMQSAGMAWPGQMSLQSRLSSSNVENQAAVSKLLAWVQTSTRLWLHTCRFLSTIAADIVSFVKGKNFRCMLLQATRFSRQVLFQLVPPELKLEPGQMTPAWMEGQPLHQGSTHHRRSSPCRVMQPKQGDARRPASSVMLVTRSKSVLTPSCARREPVK